MDRCLFDKDFLRLFADFELGVDQQRAVDVKDDARSPVRPESRAFDGDVVAADRQIRKGILAMFICRADPLLVLEPRNL
jgi:hypothetical protein